MDNELERVDDQALVVEETGKVSKRTNIGQYKNQGAMKSAGRTQVLEALTAFRGGKVGKRGLLFKALASIEADLDNAKPEIYQPARAEALKLAFAMLKDDKAGGLEDLLKQGANIQLNFNSYFAERGQGQTGQGIAVTHSQEPADQEPGE